MGEGLVELEAAARARIAELEEEDEADRELPMARLAARLALLPRQVDLVWSIVASSVDGRIVPHLEVLGGAHAGRGSCADPTWNVDCRRSARPPRV